MYTFDKQKLIRRAIFGLLLVACALLQHTRGAFLHIGNVHAWLLVPAVVAIAMQERAVPATLFGAFAGALWDYAHTGADGAFAFWFALLAFVCSTLVTFWVRNNLPAALVLSGAALVLTAVLQWFCFVVLPEQGSAAAVLFGHALPSAVFSFLFSVPLCWLVQRTAKAFSAPESAV